MVSAWITRQVLQQPGGVLENLGRFDVAGRGVGVALLHCGLDASAATDVVAPAVSVLVAPHPTRATASVTADSTTPNGFVFIE